MTQTNYSKKFAYGVLAAAIAIQLMSGLNYVWSLTSASLVANHGWTNTQASLPYSLFTVVSSAMVLIGGRLVDKLPTRRIVLLAGILLMGGLVVSSMCLNNVALFTIFYSVLLAGGTGCITASAISPTVRWFPYSKRGLISGLCYVASGCCAVFMSPICNWLVNTYGVRTSLMTLGICAGAIVIIASFFERDIDDEGIRLLEENDKQVNVNAVTFKVKEYTGLEMLKTSGFWKLYISFTALCLVGLLIIGRVAAIATLQAGWTGGYLLIVLNALFSIAGRFSCGPLAIKTNFRFVWILMCALQAVNMLCFRFYTSVPLLLLGAAIGGFCFGGIWSMGPALVSGEFGKKNMGLNFGILHTGYAIGGFVGPMLAGYFVDTYGNYNNAYLVAAAVLIVGLISALTMKKDLGVPKPVSE